VGKGGAGRWLQTTQPNLLFAAAGAVARRGKAQQFVPETRAKPPPGGGDSRDAWLTTSPARKGERAQARRDCASRERLRRGEVGRTKRRSFRDFEEESHADKGVNQVAE